MKNFIFLVSVKNVLGSFILYYSEIMRSDNGTQYSSSSFPKIGDFIM